MLYSNNKERRNHPSIKQGFKLKRFIGGSTAVRKNLGAVPNEPRRNNSALENKYDRARKYKGIQNGDLHVVFVTCFGSHLELLYLGV